MLRLHTWVRVVTTTALFAVAFAAVAQSSSPAKAVTSKATPQAATQPSWALNAGVPASCSAAAGGTLNTTVNINNPSAASEQGVLTVPGVINAGHTVDSSFTGISPNNSFAIFVDTTYNVPAHTPITLVITTFKLPNFLGGVSFVDTNTWDCTTGQFTFLIVPTLSEWALVALGLAVLAIGFAALRRRMRAT